MMLRLVSHPSYPEPEEEVKRDVEHVLVFALADDDPNRWDIWALQGVCRDDPVISFLIEFLNDRMKKLI